MPEKSSDTTIDKKGQVAAGKYLTFGLGGESYGIPILKVREIIKLIPVTAIPQMPPYIKGVLNLRGRIIPVVDMRIKFDMNASENTDRTCIVVVQVTSSTRASIHLGLIVDSVDEVSNITSADIEDTPDFGIQLDSSYLIGMAKIKNRVVSLLNIDRCLGAEDLEAVQKSVEV